MYKHLWPVLSLFVGMIVACAHVDYAYRHDVAGVVLDAASGAPLAGAVVDRVESGLTNAADPALYRRTTGPDGTFRFLYSGLGGKPEKFQRWELIVRLPGWQSVTLASNVRWHAFVDGQASYGYVLTNLRVHLVR